MNKYILLMLLSISDAYKINIPYKPTNDIISRRAFITIAPFVLIPKKTNAIVPKCYSETDLIVFGFDNCILFAIFCIIYIQNFFKL